MSPTKILSTKRKSKSGSSSDDRTDDTGVVVAVPGPRVVGGHGPGHGGGGGHGRLRGEEVHAGHALDVHQHRPGLGRVIILQDVHVVNESLLDDQSWDD